jgi:phosphoserine phosphatase RsbU/P
MNIIQSKQKTQDELIISLFDEIDTAVFVLDGAGSFIYASPAIERISGYRSDELTGRPFSMILFTDSQQIFSEIISGESHAPTRRDVWIRHAASGVVKCTIVHHRSLLGGEVRIIGIIGEKNQIDPEYEEKIKMFTMAVEQSPATVVITDKFGSIQYVNPKFSKLTGYSLNDVMGHNPRILKSGKQTEQFYRDLWQTISTGEEWRGEFHNLKKNGDSYWESASISPIMNKAGEITHYIAVKEDITARKKAEEDLRVSEDKLKTKNEQMERDLKNAQMAVSRLLPEKAPLSDRLRIDFRYLPMEKIGGDFFSFNTLHGGGMGVFIGDVAGHGVSAALFLSLVRSVTERLNTARGTKPSIYIKELNGSLTESTPLLFFTALYGYFDFSSGNVTFRFAKGGHTPPVLFRAGEKTAVSLTSNGMPVGISAAAEFQQIDIGLMPGDRMYLYTDGITEARNKKREMLETEGLLEIVRRGGVMKLGESLDYILDEAYRFRDNTPAEDDIILIGFEII